VAERCIIAVGRTVSGELLFLSWREWFESVGRKDAGTRQTFGRDLRAAIPSLQIKRPRGSDDRFRQYEGLGLKSTSERWSDA
jgi:putative DNA primase/helicase